MKHYINTQDNTIWAFDDNVNPYDFASTPTTLQLIEEPRPSNEYIWENGQWVLQQIVIETIVPSSITMRQCRLQLSSQNLLDDVETFIQTAPKQYQIEWEYATTVERTSPLVSVIAETLNLSNQTVDEFFISANLL